MCIRDRAYVAMVASGPGQSFLIAVFVDEMLVGTGLSRTTFSVLYAAGTVVSALTMLQVGRLADRFGARFVWVAASLGLAGACALGRGCGWLALCGNLRVRWPPVQVSKRARAVVSLRCPLDHSGLDAERRP